MDGAPLSGIREGSAGDADRAESVSYAGGRVSVILARLRDTYESILRR